MIPAKILVVDDEIELERLIKQRFRKKILAKELDFIFVPNGIEALEQLKNEQAIDMVLTDINMPGMDGLTLLNKMTDIDQNLKAVIVSAYGDLPNIRTAMNRGAFDFITKPIDFQDLAITIDKTLEFVHRNKEQREQLQKALDQLRYQAFYDQLTCLPNQNLLLGRIRQCLEWSKQRLSRFAILFISLECFKAVKYGLGHTFSDRVLIEVAHRVENCVKPIDTVARVGGDEFVVLLSDIKNFEEVLEKAAVIEEALKQPFKVNGSLICSNNYIGMVYSNINYEKPEDFLRAADMAMHYAKKSHQITPVLFDVSMQAKTLDRLQLEADLQEALEKQQFFVKYQPILCLETGKVVSFEALVRWHHPKRGIVSPVDFIPLAEETGIIIPLGKWVLSEACQQLKYWLEQFKNYPPMTISVNLSGMQLADPNFLDDVDHILESLSLKGSSLKLEITESILVEKAQENKDLMTQLKKRNIELSIDDFGTGYSSLAYLQTFPIDTLKIDRSFISRLTEKDKNLDITQTIITLAHSLDLDVISEGVETEEQLDILRSLQCEYGQGYLFSPPLHPQDIPKFLAEH